MTLPPCPAADFPRARTALVTGAASPRGIGRATASRLAADGWSVAVLDLDEAACQRLAEGLREEHGVACLGIGVDIRDRDAVRAAVRRIDTELPQLVGLVNNAGVSSPVPFLDVSEAEWHRVVDVNLHGTFHVTRAAAELMAERRLGRVVTVSSASAERGGGCTDVPSTRPRKRRCSASPAPSRENSDRTASPRTPWRPDPSTPTSWAAR
ncbi:SDR family NAD(P)-dependent oxidoreductase [Streptomyces sp. M19]